MASLRSLRPVLALAGRRIPVTSRPIARYHVNINTPGSASTRPLTAPWAALYFVLGVGVGGGCIAWWMNPKKRSDISSAPGSPPAADLEAFTSSLTQHPIVRNILHDMGSGSKLRLVRQATLLGQTLLDNAPNAPLRGLILFRLEDIEVERGKPNLVGFCACVQPFPDPNMRGFVDELAKFAAAEDDRGQLAKPGMAVLIVQCGERLSSAMYTRPVIGEGKPRIALP